MLYEDIADYHLCWGKFFERKIDDLLISVYDEGEATYMHATDAEGEEVSNNFDICMYFDIKEFASLAVIVRTPFCTLNGFTPSGLDDAPEYEGSM